MLASLLCPVAVVSDSLEDRESIRNLPFRLPIQYVKELHSLSENVATDLELSTKVVAATAATATAATATEEAKTTMYHPLMNPKTPFEESMIPNWGKYYTTNTTFLTETQQVIKSVGPIPIESPDYETVMTIWKDTKEDPYFLEKYSYMEIGRFKWINHHPSILQAISIVNMGSPVLGFLVPFVLFLMPFFIVKLQGHPITLSIYFSVLKSISRNHFIGKMIGSAQNLNAQNVLYLLVLVGLYNYQIYQNYIACVRFYSNISRINDQICHMQKYLAYTTATMASFEGVIKGLSTYDGFRQDLAACRQSLDRLREHIQDVCPFKPSFSKIAEIGRLLGCYYTLYSNEEYAAALQYSFGFHGYIQSLKGVHENISAGSLAFAEFAVKEGSSSSSSSSDLVIKGQYYPALANESFVTNDANLSKNSAITGPNAAGKTTYLKTTMLNIIFTQQFGCGFYSGCVMGRVYTHLHSYLNIPDTSGRDSLFQAESRRCKEIIDHVVLAPVEERHFCIFDELYSGTNPMEATKSAYAFLMWLSERPNVDFVLTTHYVDMCLRFKTKKAARIANYQMEAIESADGDISYTYRLIPGISKIQGAVKVLREMAYPEEILATIAGYDKKSEKK
jgi:hypothetical protein